MTNTSPIEKKISTRSLDLQLVKPGDADFILSLLNSKEWIENIGDRHVRSKEQAIVYIDAILVAANFYYWVVSIKETNTPIGIVSFLKREYLDNFDIGFAFLPEFTGKGYAHEATKAVLEMVSRRPGSDTVLALTKASNKRSIKLLEKLGFTYKNSTGMETEKLDIYTNAAPSTKTT